MKAELRRKVNVNNNMVKRKVVFLACLECKRRNYPVYLPKAKQDKKEIRTEFNKFCKFCRKHVKHKRTK